MIITKKKEVIDKQSYDSWWFVRTYSDEDAGIEWASLEPERLEVFASLQIPCSRSRPASVELAVKSTNPTTFLRVRIHHTFELSDVLLDVDLGFGECLGDVIVTNFDASLSTKGDQDAKTLGTKDRGERFVEVNALDLSEALQDSSHLEDCLHLGLGSSGRLLYLWG
jgi:hypothetical protein